MAQSQRSPIGTLMIDGSPHSVAQTKRQLREYFDGKRKAFTVDIELRGTPFQMSVWNELKKIPYGTTVTYGDIAQRIGSPTAVRAVGTAISNNPCGIVIPCHRVVPASGGVGNYAWGKAKKKWLLALEEAHS